MKHNMGEIWRAVEPLAENPLPGLASRLNTCLSRMLSQKPVLMTGQGSGMLEPLSAAPDPGLQESK